MDDKAISPNGNASFSKEFYWSLGFTESEAEKATSWTILLDQSHFRLPEALYILGYSCPKICRKFSGFTLAQLLAARGQFSWDFKKANVPGYGLYLLELEIRDLIEKMQLKLDSFWESEKKEIKNIVPKKTFSRFLRLLEIDLKVRQGKKI